MLHSLEKAIVINCAPTLAGHKCGSLFSHRAAHGKLTKESVGEADCLLSAKGVRVRLLRSCAEGSLVYVYRPAMLKARLSRPEVRAFLKRYAYHSAEMDACLAHLTRRIHCGADFPHEIGVFLDYPLEDVIGFITHRGCGYSCAGCWKAYGDAEAAQRRFELYQKCRRIYTDCYRRGFDVARLTVAV